MSKLASKIMFLKTLGMFLAFFLCTFSGMAQDCTLNIGGKNTEALVGVFQMNEEQIGQMETWRAELNIEIKVIEEEIQKLFDNHPQSTPEELTTLAGKYKIYQEKIVDASKATDKKLLSIFNTKQYDRYLELCHEAIREPIQVVPVVLKDAVLDPE
jgi:hypothetical protein